MRLCQRGWKGFNPTDVLATDHEVIELPAPRIRLPKAGTQGYDLDLDEELIGSGDRPHFG